ncbi:uncharacterized protein LOC120416376 [Culex pipiens pallens]|uniref:uncharacterized protein LOC120416376 n=1 Tax=Culex pipiens pallens TaxID=42434 RepID=UPI0019539609|nr:uncharacterized protein LOC120416376 [Culex pipiens pallens]
MTTWKLLLVLGLAVGATRCSDLEIHDEEPDIVCMVNIYPDISDAILNKLEVCDFIIVSYDGLCDFARHLKNYSDAKRVALIRGRAPHAKILRKVEVKFDETFDPNHAVQNVEGSLAAGLFDGVELAFDSAHLDQHEQIKYAQFLKLLKRHLDDHVLISNSFVCQHHLPAFLLNAMSEVLDYVILVPSSQNASAEGNALAPRVYSDSVCELQNEQQRHCEEQQYQNCSLFEDGVKLVYDDPNSAGGRALQVVGCKLRGISIALSYDDPAGICVGSSFPLLGAVQNVFEHRSGVSGFRGCPCGTDESEEEEHETDSPCHSSEHHQSDSHEADDCCCNSEKPCDGCKLLNRLQGAVKTSEHVAGISKSVADKVLESLDRVVELVSYTMGQRPELPESPQPAPFHLHLAL